MTSHMLKRRHKNCAKSRPLPFCTIIALMFTFGTAMAETVYVDDTLRIGVRAEPSGHVSSLSIISSGTALEILERRAGYTRVRTPSGQQGWVKSAYLTTQRPLRFGLEEAKKKIDGLEHELAQARNSAKTSSLTATSATKDKELAAMASAESSVTSDEGLRKTLAELERDKARLMQQVRDARQKSATAPSASSRFVNWVDSITGDANPNLVLIALIGLMLSIGFIMGMGWHQRHVSRRLGGIRL